MTQKEHNLLPEFDFESRLPGESSLAFAYFELYRDAGSQRSLRALCECEVNGKKRTLSQFGKWSSRYHWQTRVEAYEAEIAHDAFLKLAEQRREEITEFIANDMSIALELQKLCKIRLRKLAVDTDNTDCRELRQLALAYRESRQWLMELTGIVEDHSVDENQKS
ncbi:MAG: hypothetical protein OXT74_03080 [Candidatus Poribacteria bacterium]|nr:hypothetical protein [Candidatus Poribacteria bacterium]